MITTPNCIEPKIYELQNSTSTLKSEHEEFKQILLKLWIQTSKSFNEDFEEILQLGINSDIQDVVNSILIIEEARLEQIQSDRQQIQLLKDEIQALKQQNSVSSVNNELSETQKQYTQLSELVIQLKQSNEEKDHQILEQTKLNSQLQIELNLLTSQITNLSLALVQSKEEKIQYMEQSQKEFKQLTEKDLQQSKMIQALQIQIIELETMVKQNSQRNSVESSNHKISQTYLEVDQAKILSCSPSTISPYFKEQLTLIFLKLFYKVSKTKKLKWFQDNHIPKFHTDLENDNQLQLLNDDILQFFLYNLKMRPVLDRMVFSTFINLINEINK